MPSPLVRRRAALSQGVREYIYVNGISYRLLLGFDNQPLKGDDGQYLYGGPDGALDL